MSGTRTNDEGANGTSGPDGRPGKWDARPAAQRRNTPSSNGERRSAGDGRRSGTPRGTDAERQEARRQKLQIQRPATAGSRPATEAQAQTRHRAGGTRPAPAAGTGTKSRRRRSRGRGRSTQGAPAPQAAQHPAGSVDGGPAVEQAAPAPAPASTTPPAAGKAPAPAGGTGFADLGVPDALVAALAAQGIDAPFEIQAATMADALAGHDVLGQARTGSGKTLAFSVPVATMLQGRRGKAGDAPKALVLVPTRELANQVAATLEPLCTAAGVRVTTIYGGVGHQPQRQALRAGTEVLVACPGRMWDHVQAGDADLGRVEITVVDEADHMADQGFLPVVRRLLDQVPADSQTMLFSATLAGGVDKLVGRYLDQPRTHTVADGPPARLDHHVRTIADDQRTDTVAELCDGRRAVVFCRTKHRAKRLCQQLVARGVPAVELHGNLGQTARERNLAAFSDGTATVLVCTDIAARGIHVDDVPLVVHADVPVEHKAYTHRSGRTARAGAAGTVITLCTRDEHADVKRLLGKAGVTAAWD